MKDLTVRSETIQVIYGYYIQNRLLVNRKYQRKLVWNIEEKSAFIDSIQKCYPIPLILLAELNSEENSPFEIIDGMQRLNAIISFIEGEFTLDGKYFDLEVMAYSKLKKDKNELVQKTPVLERELCAAIASYSIPLSIYKIDSSDQIDDIFRRINSNGKHLSKQEIRQAGAISDFANLIRELSSQIRGDASVKDRLLLNEMKKISITNKNLEYGINVDEVFWVKNTIIRREQVRESKDEEIIADILAYMLLEDKPISSSKMLDELYGIRDSRSKRHIEIEQAIKIKGKKQVVKEFYQIIDIIESILKYSNKKFNEIIFNGDNSKDKIPRYFQVVFLALYTLIIYKNLKVSDIKLLINKLEGISKSINISQGGGTWAAIERDTNVKAVVGILECCFTPNMEDPALYRWSKELETILSQSTTEQSSFDFKIGFCNYTDEKFINKTFSKAIKTLTAMANRGKNELGYIIIGVADKLEDAQVVEKITGEKHIQIGHHLVTGVNHDMKILNLSSDRYYQKIIQLIEKEPIDKKYISKITSDIKFLNYAGKDVIILRLENQNEAILYGNSYYERRGGNNTNIEMKDIATFLRKFDSIK